MKIGILGGTFDPIHRGHLALARYARDQFQLDQVIFVPSARPPHKKNRRSLTPTKHRMAMVKLAVGTSQRYKVSDIEARRRGFSYTIDTLKTLHEKHPSAALYLILGQDSYDALGRWRQPAGIRKMAHLLIAERPGNSGKRRRDPRNVSWIKMPLYFIASTNLRKALGQGKSLIRYLHPRVLRYIKTHDLYRCKS